MKTLKNKMTILSLALVTLALGACSQCPTTDASYDQFPYNNVRTAGTGTAIYGGNCAKPVMAKETPAPVVVEKKAEAVFTKSQRK